MRRIFSIIAMLTIIALFNIGGCGGSDDSNGYKPTIDRIVFYENSDKIKQVSNYTQGSEGVVEITISDYDLNAETIEVQVNQCDNDTCDKVIFYHTPGIYELSQTDTRFNYTFPDLGNSIKILPATYYYQFVFEAVDRNGQSSVSKKIIQIDKGIPPIIEDIYFYNDRYPGERVDTWNTYYNFVAEFKARDLDVNAKCFYINRTCLETTDPNETKPTFVELGPLELLSDDTNTEDMEINTNSYVSQNTRETNLVQSLLSVKGVYEITIKLEDALGNTAEMSKNITITN